MRRALVGVPTARDVMVRAVFAHAGKEMDATAPLKGMRPSPLVAVASRRSLRAGE